MAMHELFATHKKNTFKELQNIFGNDKRRPFDIQWTVPSLSHQTTRKKSLVHNCQRVMVKCLVIKSFSLFYKCLNGENELVSFCLHYCDNLMSDRFVNVRIYYLNG